MALHHARIVTVAILILGTVAGCAPDAVKPASSPSSTTATPVQGTPEAVSPELLRMARRLGYRPMRLFCRGSYPYRLDGGSSLYHADRGACLYHGARGYRPVILYCNIEVPIGTSFADNNCVNENDLRWEWQRRQF